MDRVLERTEIVNMKSNTANDTPGAARARRAGLTMVSPAMVLMLFDKRDMVALSLPTNNDRLIIDCRFCCLW